MLIRTARVRSTQLLQKGKKSSHLLTCSSSPEPSLSRVCSNPLYCSRGISLFCIVVQCDPFWKHYLQTVKYIFPEANILLHICTVKQQSKGKCHANQLAVAVLRFFLCFSLADSVKNLKCYTRVRSSNGC